MPGGKRTCKGCCGKFIGSARAQYCSPACKQRAHRGRGSDRNANRNAPSVTVTLPAGGQAHSAEAAALLQALDDELSLKSDLMGLPPEQPLEWSTVERAVLETIADTIDRRVDLQRRYDAAEDDKARVKLSGEIRLLQRLSADLLKRVSTELPPAQSHTSAKASRAAQARWARAQN